MTTNVIDAIREKDKTLQEVIDFCTNWKNALYNDREGSHENLVQADALTRVICKCESMLGSGSMPSCLTYEDWDDSSEDNQPQVGDYGVAVRGTEDGQEEIPFHIEREERPSRSGRPRCPRKSRRLGIWTIWANAGTAVKNYPNQGLRTATGSASPTPTFNAPN